MKKSNNHIVPTCVTKDSNDIGSCLYLTPAVLERSKSDIGWRTKSIATVTPGLRFDVFVNSEVIASLEGNNIHLENSKDLFNR